LKILVHGINYYPELTGIGKYTAEMCEWLVSRGHSVRVITAMPYYPQWVINDNYKGKHWHKEMIRGVEVCRVPLYIPPPYNVNGRTRIIQEISFAISSLYYIIPSLFKKYDYVISICPPFHLGFHALLFQFFKGVPVIYHIQDLQVDAARIKSNFFLNILENAETFILKKVKRISSISQGMRKNILKKGIPEDKYINLPNWVDVDFIQPLTNAQSLREELGFKPRDKIVLYSGNMGEKQGLEVILNVAEKLRLIGHLYFIMVGEGGNKKTLLQEAKDRDLCNVKFFPLQPYLKLSAMLAMADLHLVLQKKAAADLVMPSKIMTVLAAGGVAIVTAETGTTLYDLICNHNIGIIIPPENEDALAAVIEKSINSNLDQIKINARNYALNKLSIHKILMNFEKELFKLSTKNG
jgi:colanic acid biosynthesis glycosyl transferase WcaI